MLFGNWSAMLLHTIVIGGSTYFLVIPWLRISGQRTRSKWNAFDSIVTFALGSVVATATLSPKTQLADGAIAIGLLVVLQFAITWLSVRSSMAAPPRQGRARSATGVFWRMRTGASA